MQRFCTLSSLNVLILFFSGFLSGCNTTDTGISKPFPDCFDNIQNQGEQGIDCGGPCVPCSGKITAIIDGVPWESTGNVSSSTNNNSILISSGNGTSSLSLIYSGAFVNGTFNLQSALYGINATGVNYVSNQGSITFNNWDDINKQVSGTFSFTAFESSGAGDTIQVTNGIFNFVPF